MTRNIRGPDKKKRKSRIYEPTVRMQLKLKPYLADWVWGQSNKRPSQVISHLISEAMIVEQMFLASEARNERLRAEGKLPHVYDVYDE